MGDIFIFKKLVEAFTTKYSAKYVLNYAVKILEKYPCGNTFLITHITPLLIFFKYFHFKSVAYSFWDTSGQLIRRAPAVATSKKIIFLCFFGQKVFFLKLR